jgi:hypothetical protein
MSLKGILIMYYELTDFYKRDTYFVYSEERNPVSWTELRTGEKHFFNNVPIIYEADKIDTDINNYDILPYIGIPLVSAKFKELFYDLEESAQVQFFKAKIEDKRGNLNGDFFALNILNVIPCMDMEKSIYETKVYGKTTSYSIKKLYIRPNSLQDFSIARMKEQDSYIVVSENFKKRCDKAHLKGIKFLEEGYSIYND